MFVCVDWRQCFNISQMGEGPKGVLPPLPSPHPILMGDAPTAHLKKKALEIVLIYGLLEMSFILNAKKGAQRLLREKQTFIMYMHFYAMLKCVRKSIGGGER